MKLKNWKYTQHSINNHYYNYSCINKPYEMHFEHQAQNLFNWIDIWYVSFEFKLKATGKYRLCKVCTSLCQLLLTNKQLAKNPTKKIISYFCNSHILVLCLKGGPKLLNNQRGYLKNMNAIREFFCIKNIFRLFTLFFISVGFMMSHGYWSQMAGNFRLWPPSFSFIHSFILLGWIIILWQSCTIRK